MKKKLWLKILLGIVAAILAVVIGLVVYLTVTEYRPRDVQDAEWIYTSGDAAWGRELTVYTWNIGYAGLDANTDFFMDGGSTVNPSKDAVTENLAAISDFIASHEADAWLLQEVDVHSKRTGYVNELEAIADGFAGNYAMAYNYKCDYVPFPLPTIGKVESGIATFASGRMMGSPQRIALPCPFSWPVSTANLKRCLLVTRMSVAGSDKEVVLVNLHLEAYDDGEGKIAQTNMLMNFLQAEYEKGNYVIAGGDFNQVFPETLESFPLREDSWTPGVLEENALPTGFSYAFDGAGATCRLLNRPYDADSQLYVLDGFIVSPNVRIEQVQTQRLDFAHSDHNPVRLDVTLLEK